MASDAPGRGGYGHDSESGGVEDRSAQPSGRDSPDRLDSWKEIAAHLNRDVRTVRRWEKNQGLPVHRHLHLKGPSIYAFRSELDAWWKGQQSGPRPVQTGAETGATTAISRPTGFASGWLTRALWGALIGIGVLAVGAYVAISHYTVRRAQRAGQMVLAVLPFDDLSSDPQDYLGDGLTEEMIQKATRISPQHLRVIARTSAMQYRHTQKSAREIGQELGADYILENSIRHEGARLRITTQLVRTADQTHLWAENYDREMRSLLSVEGDVTAEIAEQLRLQLAPPASNRRAAKPRPANPEAHELYLQGRYLFNQRSRAGLQQSLNYFQRAAEKDPGYAAAYAGMADAYNLIAFFGFDPTLGSVSQAKIAADKALQLDDTMAAAHAALAYTEFMWRGDWPAAEREFQRALQLDDNYVPAHHWYALYLASIGRMDESLNQMRYAQRLDPLSPAVHAGLGYMYYFARDYDHAIEQARVALQLNPDFMVAHAVLGWAYTEQKNYPLATAELEAATRLSGGVSVYQCALGRAYALSGNVREARKILAAQRSSVAGAPQGSGSILASLYLALGDSEQALHWLEVTAPGDIQANWLRVDPAFDGLRGNPRFAEVQRRIGTARQD